MLLLLLLLLFISHAANSASATVRCNRSERDALLNFKQALIDPSDRLSSWVGQDCCKWYGVGCSNSSAHVTKLDLRHPFPLSETDFFDFLYYTEESPRKKIFSRLCLGGEIHNSLVSLTHLTYLDLSMNNFSDIQIPSFLASLKKLEYLNLSYASFQGKVPHHFGNLSNLQYLDLKTDSGHLVSVDNLNFVSTLSSLKYLDLSGVNLSKANDWLHSINMLPSLIHLHLSECQLSYIPHNIPHVNFTSLSVLVLSSNNFANPTIPSFLFNISTIQHLDLSNNVFQGSIPSDMGSWKSLSLVDLSNNMLEGKIPAALRNLCNLREVILSYNRFSGEIFGALGFLTGCIKSNLVTLNLAENYLNGSLPNDQFRRFRDLQILYLNDNSFSGPIPESIGWLSRLRELLLSNNRLNGSIPASIGQLSDLKILNVFNNSLDGLVSELHFSNLTALNTLILGMISFVFNMSPTWVPPFQLQFLTLSSCPIGSQFPQWLKTQTKIEYLLMANASISDSIPDWFQNISSSFSLVDLSSNRIEGNLPKLNPKKLIYLMVSSNYFNGSIPNFLCRFKDLIVLDLSKNQLTGRLPRCWKNSSSFQMFDLSNNNLSGHIPTSLGSLQQLVSLHLQHNRLHGKIPRELNMLRYLGVIDLSENAFEGVIPPWIGENLSSLEALNLGSNRFYGELPSELCGLPLLQILSVANNHLTGSIPPCFKNLTAMTSNDNYGSFWSFGGTLYSENLLIFMKGLEIHYTKTLEFLFSVDLSGNNFVGEIPEELTTLSRLQNLNLSRNNFGGHIPFNIGKLKQLESLDLSFNGLSGSIPSSISDLNFLSYLNLSYNNLSGRIPLGNQLQALEGGKSIYIGNTELCGTPLEKCQQDDNLPEIRQPIETTDDEFEFLWFYCGIGTGYFTGFVGFCITLYFKDSWRYALFQFVDKFYDKLYVVAMTKANWRQKMFEGHKLQRHA